MNLFTKQYTILFFILSSFILVTLLFHWIDYLSKNEYIMECFTGAVPEEMGGSTSHTVNLPLTTTYSCQNFCGPTARCSITGQQCFADIDCPGCQPNIPPLKRSNVSIPGDNDAGKLTLGVTPQYSSLTSGYGTQETKITSNMYSKPTMATFGIDTWTETFDEGKALFDKRYKPSANVKMLNYPERYTLTGQFIEDGPFAANSAL